MVIQEEDSHIRSNYRVCTSIQRPQRHSCPPGGSMLTLVFGVLNMVLAVPRQVTRSIVSSCAEWSRGWCGWSKQILHFFFSTWVWEFVWVIFLGLEVGIGIFERIFWTFFSLFQDSKVLLSDCFRMFESLFRDIQMICSGFRDDRSMISGCGVLH